MSTTIDRNALAPIAVRHTSGCCGALAFVLVRREAANSAAGVDALRIQGVV
jgi:hypothetical protein